MQKPILKQTPAIQALKAELRNYARTHLKPQHAPGFEQYANEQICLVHISEGHITPKSKCRDCFGRGYVQALIEPGKKITKESKWKKIPCKCTYSQYLDVKPHDQVILPVTEYGKSLEPTPKAPKPKPKSTRKTPAKSGTKRTKKEPGEGAKVRKNKSSISGKAKD